MLQETDLQSQLKPPYNGTYVRTKIEYGASNQGLTLAPENAVDPQNYEANLALDLEIADLINSKKGTA